MSDDKMIIAVDFDGTIVKHTFPEIGQPVPSALDWLHKFKLSGARLILWTMRSGLYLEQAVDYCAQNRVHFFGVNHNPDQMSWTRSPKAYAHLYIDDAAAGCPLVIDPNCRPYVDWSVVGPSVMQMIRHGREPLDLSPDAVAKSMGHTGLRS